MSKKYFAKYLPVENGFKRVVKNSQGIPIDYEQEVKLFLCSKDIQIGDSLTSMRGTLKGYSEEEWDIKTLINQGIKAKWYKVVGEISKEAVWVKEGDVFTEEEVQICTTYISKITRDWIKEEEEYFSYNYNTYSNEKNMITLDIIMLNGESGIQNVSIDDLIIKNTFKILNPSCKHYH